MVAISGAPPLPLSSPIVWPNGKKFAFTIFDDTDRAILHENRRIYRLLQENNIFTTKSAWMMNGDKPAYIPGETCDNPDYTQWLKEIQALGFEIGWHLATWETADRHKTIRALDRFQSLFGHSPATMANHASNLEGIYWGKDRFSRWRRVLYGILTQTKFEGHLEHSPLFWGDECKNRIRYVRNFVFSEINTLKSCPWMPYEDPTKPFVNYWFASSNGADVNDFNRLLAPTNLDKLEREGGACIVYTHFGKGFSKDGSLDPVFVKRIEDLSRRSGWFVPVAKLLEFLLTNKISPCLPITRPQLSKLENRWLVDYLVEKSRHILRNAFLPRRHRSQ